MRQVCRNGIGTKCDTGIDIENAVTVKKDDPAIVVYGKIINSLESIDAIKDFIKDVYRIYQTERRAVITVGRKYIDIIEVA